MRHPYLDWRDRFAEVISEPPVLYTIEYLDCMIAGGTARIWTSPDAAIVAEILTYPSGAKVVHGVIAAGDLEQILGLIPQAEAWGREQGAIGAEIESRAGWARALKDYRVMQTKLWKDF